MWISNKWGNRLGRADDSINVGRFVSVNRDQADIAE